MLLVERLEDRTVLSAIPSIPSTFTVLNLSNSGAGSFRQAILGANAHPGADNINFSVVGTIRLTSGALPTITGNVNIDGSTAPGFAGTPLVGVDYNHFEGLIFNSGSTGSTLRSLDLANAVGNGVTLNGVQNMLVVGNYIGVALDGIAFAGNGANGLQLFASSGVTVGGSTAQDRNLISANRYNGIYMNASSQNLIEGNYLGTDLTGTRDLGNGGNGVLITGGSSGNLIGGNDTAGNDPTNGIFAIPPEGNLISGNDGNGVLITGGSSTNTLSGNFIGTAASGNSALGNGLDGVAIVSANGNSLIGCTLLDNPFVYYNVISGNGANGLSVFNSNNTTIQANFFGMAADNDSPLGNHLNGVLIKGSSSGTIMGGPIPLGNVDAANGQNGLEVRDTASFFTSYNTFCGLAAFSNNPNLGNGHDGMLITSTGGNILIRTNVIAENGNDGIEISGSARGVRVAGNIIGLNTQGVLAMGNRRNGVEVNGNAHDIIIGGPQATFNIIFHNAISANGVNGVAIDGHAYNVTVSFSNIGTDLTGFAAVGNAQAGVYIGSGTRATTIGSTDPDLPTVISGNLGNGVEMHGSRGNIVVGCFIGIDRAAALPLPNAGNGILLSNSSNNIIGRVTAGVNASAVGPANVIAFNGANGVYVDSGTSNAIRENSIYGNALLAIKLGPWANKNASAPVLSSVVVMPLGTQVSGTLTSTPNSNFTIEFYADDLNRSSGRVFLGSKTVRTNAAGYAVFTFVGIQLPNGYSFVTASATDSQNNTSEFSAAKRRS